MTTAGRLSGTLGDRYRIEREIGQGGMATVYLGHADEIAEVGGRREPVIILFPGNELQEPLS